MRKFYQIEWFNIQFNSFSIMNPNKIADEKFYKLFYKQFFLKFNSYDDLPNEWKVDKEQLVNFIYKNINNHDKVISIGCGNGYIEYSLNKKWGGEIVAIEPSILSSHWLKDVDNIRLLNGFFPDILGNKTDIDFAYMSYVDYVLDDKLYIKLLQDIKKYKIKNFLLVGASIYTPTIQSTIKGYIKNIFSYIGLYKQQFWGYQRTESEHIQLFKKVGFKNIEYGKLKNNIFWIKVINE